MATTYTEVPSTSDSNYWQIKRTNKGDRSTVFVPRDKALHRSLLEPAWAAIQKRHPYADRNKAQ